MPSPPHPTPSVVGTSKSTTAVESAERPPSTDDADSTPTLSAGQVAPGASAATTIGVTTSAASTATATTATTDDSTTKSSGKAVDGGAVLTVADIDTVDGDTQAPAYDRSVVSSAGIEELEQPVGETARSGVSASPSACE